MGSSTSRIILFGLTVITLLTFLVSGCDYSPTATEQDDRLQVLPMPDFGSTPLPGIASDLVRTAAPGTETAQSRPAYDMLTAYAENHPENPYVGAVGVWDAEKERYIYKSGSLQFPDSLIRETNSEWVYFRYRLLGTDGKNYRILAGLVPPKAEAMQMMKEWLRYHDQSKVVNGGTKSSKSARPTPIAMSSDPCDEDYLPGTFCTGNELDEMVIAASTEASFQAVSLIVTWPDGLGQGPGNQDDGHRGGGGTPRNNDPDPCDTDGKYPMFEDPNFQDQMDSMFKKQQDTGVEQAGVGIKNNYGGYTLQPIPDNLITEQTYKKIKFYIDPLNVPSGSIYIHTEPTRQTLRVHGQSFDNMYKPSRDDYNTMDSLSAKKNIRTGFILGQDRVIVFNKDKVTDSFGRCGY